MDLGEETMRGVFGTVAAPEGRWSGGKDVLDSGELTCLGRARTLLANSTCTRTQHNGAIHVFGPVFPRPRGTICRLEARVWLLGCWNLVELALLCDWSSFVLPEPIDTIETDRLCRWPCLPSCDPGGAGGGHATDPDRLLDAEDGTLRDNADR